MEQQVRVIAIEGDQALVAGQRASACGKCASQHSCSSKLPLSDHMIELSVKNTLHAQVGNLVLLDLPDALLLKIAFQLYGLPMFTFIVIGILMRGLAIDMDWPQPDVLAVLAGIVSIAGCYSLIRSKVAVNDNMPNARMIRILDGPGFP